MRKVLLGFATLQLVAVIAQFYLATFGAFERPLPPPGTGAIEPHAINGIFVLPLLALLTAIVAAVAKAGGRMIGLSLVPLAISLAQLLVVFPLAEMVGWSDDQPTTTAVHAVLGLHGLLGLLLMWAAAVLFRDAGRAAAPEPAAAPAGALR